MIQESSTLSRDLATYICRQVAWSELPVDEMAEDIDKNPGLYYPEYVHYCRAFEREPAHRAQWRRMVLTHA